MIQQYKKEDYKNQNDPKKITHIVSLMNVPVRLILSATIFPNPTK